MYIHSVMTDRQLQQAWQAAQGQLVEAVRQRDQLNVTIIRLQNQMRALQAAVIRDKLASRALQQHQALVGLTEAIRTVLRLGAVPMQAGQIKSTLDVMGFDFSSFSHPSAAVHNTLKRMASSGELLYVLAAKTYRMVERYEY